MKFFLKEVDEHLRTRIRMIIWKMWKLPKTREDNLVKCGYSREEARGLAMGGSIYKFKFKLNSNLGRRLILFVLSFYLVLIMLV